MALAEEGRLCVGVGRENVGFVLQYEILILLLLPYLYHWSRA